MKHFSKLAIEWYAHNRILNREGMGTFSQLGAFEAGYRQALEDAARRFQSEPDADEEDSDEE